MQDALRTKILSLLDEHRIMSLATIRPDGWPQATTVGYANDGLAGLYFFVAPASQKAKNIGSDNRVSLTIDHDTTDTMAITGLSMAARVQAVTEPVEIAKAMALLGKKYPEYAAMPQPDISQILVLKAVPTIISVLDYTKGFGHSDLVTIADGDIRLAAA